eukprot:COSAG04_NODE_18485_length_440_cov_1.058651_1_plen_63_part_10
MCARLEAEQVAPCGRAGAEVHMRIRRAKGRAQDQLRRSDPQRLAWRHQPEDIRQESSGSRPRS